MGEWKISAIVVCGNDILISPVKKGIYRSGDNGASWIKSDTGFAPNTTIKCFLHRGDTIFAGTSGYGVYKSVDKGKRWIPVNTGISNALVTSLCFAGNDLFAGTDNSGGFPSNYKGLFRSSDGGTTWTPSGVAVGLETKNIFSLLSRSDTLLAGTDEGVYVSLNKGTTWAVSTQGMVNNDVNALALKDGKIFAGTKYWGVSVSADGGAHWTGANAGIGESTNCWILTFHEINGRLLVGTPGRLFFLADSGKGWVDATGSLPNGADITSLGKKDDVLYAGTIQGLFRSSNNGSSWIPVSSAATNGEIVSLFDYKGTLFAGATNQGIFSSADNGNSWQAANTGFNISRGAKCFMGYTNTLYAGTWSGIVFSNDNGKSWSSPANNGASLVVMSSLVTKEGYLFAATLNGMLRSTDNGENWTTINSGFRTRMLSSEIYSLAQRNDTLFAGPYGGGIYFSTDNGDHWSASAPGLGTNNVLSMLTIKNVFIAGSRGMGVYRSLDGGFNWECPNDGKSHFWSTVVYFLAEYNNAVFAGTEESGVWLSKDDGLTWTEVNEGLSARTAITALTISGKYLIIGTPNDGAWRRPLSEMVDVVKDHHVPAAVPVIDNVKYIQSTTYIKMTFMLQGKQMASMRIYDASGKLLTSQELYDCKSGINSFTWNTCTAAPGVYYMVLETGTQKYVKSIPVAW
jgi:photosystem II stability/assembly factor-like uncharacterized protein